MLSVAVSLLSDSWKWQWTPGLASSEREAASPSARSATKESERRTLRSNPAQRQNAHQVISTPIHGGFLKFKAQLTQLQREHEADAESLYSLEVASAANSRLAKRKDHESLRFLEAATAAKAGLARRLDRESLRTLEHAYRQVQHLETRRIASGLSLPSSPGSSPLSRVHGLHGTPVSWMPPSSSVARPQPPPQTQSADLTGLYKVRFAQTDAEREHRRPGEMNALAEVKGDEATDHELIMERLPEKEVTPNAGSSQHDYICDPFGSQLVERSESAERCLQEALQRYREEQSASVHRLLEPLRRTGEAPSNSADRCTALASPPSHGVCKDSGPGSPSFAEGTTFEEVEDEWVLASRSTADQADELGEGSRSCERRSARSITPVSHSPSDSLESIHHAQTGTIDDNDAEGNALDEAGEEWVML